VTEKPAKQFDARSVFLMLSVDSWLNHLDNPRIGQDKQSIRKLPTMTGGFDLRLLGLGMLGFITLAGAFSGLF
jgi:hypothetical protein